MYEMMYNVFIFEIMISTEQKNTVIQKIYLFIIIIIIILLFFEKTI